jgi:5-methyltetrahydrofolate--homocysteine methyltransferase
MKKERFLDILKSRVLIMDGATGTQLQKKKYLDGVIIPEELNIKFPERISEIYSSYIEAGSDIILANTFGANPIRLQKHNLLYKADDIIREGISLIRKAAGTKEIIAAGDISPLGEYMVPLGQYSFDEVYNAFAYQASLLQKHGADIIIIVTMTEIKELKAAILAARDNFEGAIIAQMTFEKDGSTVTGTDIQSFAAMAENLGADALGLNCSIGSQDLAALAQTLMKNTSLPVSFKPNAGMPMLVNRETIFPESKEEFVQSSLKAYSCGVNMLGGCCGTSPQFIKALAGELKNKVPQKREKTNKFFLSSRIRAVDINELPKPVLIGERINPTNRKKFQEELLNGSMSSVKEEARAQEKDKAVLIDVNMGVPGANEVPLLSEAVNRIQEIVSTPLCIDSSSPEALEEAVKNCAGRPVINSVNAEEEKLARVVPLAKRYGAALIALTTDDKGIPKTCEERIEIAKKIVSFADKCGFPRENLIFDYLALSASSSPEQAGETLKALKKSKELWPECKTVLGVSNISFGLPSRQTVNSTFLNMAAQAGLDFAIANPHENWTINDPLAKALLENKDKGAAGYMAAFASYKKIEISNEAENVTPEKQLYFAVLNGDKDAVAPLLETIISKSENPFETVSGCALEALNAVGEKFASKEYFLPQIIMSAQAAQEAFAIIKNTLKKSASQKTAGKVIMATVKGDMHDIGKNIVCAVLESYGFDIIDMGVNVESRSIIERAAVEKPIAIGLSALMTTTMPEMEKSVKLKNESGLNVKIMVGGAAVTGKYAREIGADHYSPDAMGTAKYLLQLIKN